MNEDYSLEKLKTKIEAILENKANILNLYAVVKDNQSFNIRRIKFDEELTSELKEHMEKSIKNSVVYGSDTTLMNLSECDARRDVVCKLDMEIGGELSAFVELNNNHGDGYQDFNIDIDLSGLSALIVDIGNSSEQIQVYNHIYPMEILGKNKLTLRVFDNRLRKVNSPLLRINNSFQALQVNGSIVITDMKFIEKHAGYSRVIKEKATVACSVLQTFGCIGNIECYEELIETDISFARKLSRVTANSPVIRKNVLHSNIINFCKSYPSLKNKISFNSDETKIILTTKVSKDLVLKLFLDDHLTSELTDSHYESHAKDNVD